MRCGYMPGGDCKRNFPWDTDIDLRHLNERLEAGLFAVSQRAARHGGTPS
jgi:hypothetical protein